MENLKGNTFIGVVEDNVDPKKLGRCRVRVLNIYDDIEKEDLPWAKPWKDLGGNQFNVPDVGKIVTVVFDTGNIYKPEFIYGDHFNINLENKINGLSEEDYLSLKSIFFDHSTQIYRTKSEGLKMDHEYTNINLDQNGNILLNLRDNKSVITLGSRDAGEEAVLGTTFMSWMDSFLENLSGLNGPPFLDSLGAPVVVAPSLISCLGDYMSRRGKFLSQHVRISKNGNIIPQTRPYNDQKGDSWESTTTENSITSQNTGGSYQPESVVYNPQTGESSSYTDTLGGANNPANFSPSDQQAAISYDIPTSQPDTKKYGKPATGVKWQDPGPELEKGRLCSGFVPAEVRFPSKWLNGDKKGKWITSDIKGTDQAYLAKEASLSFDALFDLYESTSFPGKAPITISSGYRSYENQKRLRADDPAIAAAAGKSNHGWGLAVDISGISSPYGRIKKGPQIASAFRTPVYQWLFANAWKFGIYSPDSLRLGNKPQEYWHWEWWGDKGPPKSQLAIYSQPFTGSDLRVLREYGVTSPEERYIKTWFDAHPELKDK